MSSSAIQERSDSRELLTAAANGAVGGLLGTVTMTVYRMPIARSLPPTEAFWTRYGLGEEGERSPLVALFLHLSYGIGGGAVFGAAFAMLGSSEEPEANREAKSAVLGLLYGVVLSVFGRRVIVERLLGQDLAADEALVFHGGHLVYALTLGTWVGSRVERSD